MAASRIVEYVPLNGEVDTKNAPLVCNCTIELKRGNEKRRVKGRDWLCPSCGLDKTRKLAEMCSAQGAKSPGRMITLTLPAVEFVDGVVPEGFEHCDLEKHVKGYRRQGRGAGQWAHDPSKVKPGFDGWSLRLVCLAECRFCQARVSKMKAAFRKRVRRMWPDFQYLWVDEDHKSGALHVHMMCTGLPVTMGRSTRSGRALKRAWKEVGGGFVDLGHVDQDVAGARAGYYLAKYLTKQTSRKRARGYRRWSRTQGFASDVKMVEKLPPRPWRAKGLPIEWMGWVNPLAPDVPGHRAWLTVVDIPT